MREVNFHRVPGAMNDELVIQVIDGPGPGGANHYYVVSGFGVSYAGHPYSDDRDGPGRAEIRFQEGPIKEAGINGLTHEVLLAIVIDRLASFQAGPFACQENQDALMAVSAALDHLKLRTRRRLERGVEGKSVV